MKINGRGIGAEHPCYIIAEISANHQQEFDKAIGLIYAAQKAGADAVKLQTYTPDILVNKGDERYDLYSKAYMPWEWQPKLKKLADQIGITLFSTVYDNTAVDFLENMGVPAYKIASLELTNLELIRYVAQKGKPMILSTGLGTIEEIRSAVETALNAGLPTWQIALLKCSVIYPTPPENMNLGAIPKMQQVFGIPVGLSNHNLDRAIPITAVALGASIIEQHITFDKKSIDGYFSLLPEEFTQMVQDVRITEKSLGAFIGPTELEKPKL